MGTPPLMVPRRKLGLDEGLRRMVATWGPVPVPARCWCCCRACWEGGWPCGASRGSGSVRRLTVEAGRLLWNSLRYCRLRSLLRGTVQDLSKSLWLRPSSPPCSEM